MQPVRTLLVLVRDIFGLIDLWTNLVSLGTKIYDIQCMLSYVDGPRIGICSKPSVASMTMLLENGVRSVRIDHRSILQPDLTSKSRILHSRDPTISRNAPIVIPKELRTRALWAAQCQVYDFCMNKFSRIRLFQTCEKTANSWSPLSSYTEELRVTMGGLCSAVTLYAHPPFHIQLWKAYRDCRIVVKDRLACM